MVYVLDPVGSFNDFIYSFEKDSANIFGSDQGESPKPSFADQS